MKKASNIYIGLACALVIAGFYLSGTFETAEQQALDILFKVRGERKSSPAIVIVEIGDESLKEFGRWPWTRGYHAALLEMLQGYKPKVVAFDILFSEPQYEHPEEDELLAVMSERLGNVFHAMFFVAEQGRPEGGSFFKAQSLTLPLPSLLERSRGVGFVNSFPEADGKVRRAGLFVEYQDKAYPSLDLAAAAEYLNTDVKRLNIPCDRNGMMWINYAGSFQRFSRVSFSDVARSFDRIKSGQPPSTDPNLFKDKIVLIGLTAVGSQDLWPTPFSPLYPGIGVHANVINTILGRNYLRRVGRPAVLLILLAFGVVLGAVVPKRTPFEGLASFLIMALGLVLIAVLLFRFLDVWVDVVAPLAALCVAFLAITLNQFVTARFEKGLIEKELQIASRIQQSMLPNSLPEIRGLELAVRCIPAKQVGGDFYDFIKFLYDFVEFRDKKLGIVIGDVSGKGVPAALFMAKTMSDFRSLVHTHNEPHEALSAINERLTREGVPGMFVTLLYLIYEPESKIIKYSNGGHNPLIWIRDNGESKLLIQEVGPPIGIVSDSEFRTDEIRVAEGDTLIIYTDGVSEARDRSGKEFGEDRILDIARRFRGLPAKELAEKLTDEVMGFSRRAPQHDDITVIALKSIA